MLHNSCLDEVDIMMGQVFMENCWLVVLGLMALSNSISVYIESSPREREKKKRDDS